MPPIVKSIAFHLVILLSLSFYACQKQGLSPSAVRVEGNIEVLLHSKDRSRQGQIVLEGFVYSRDTQQYLLGAVITIQDSIDIYTDEKGYFFYQGSPGKYQIRCNFSSHHKLHLSSVKVRENERLLFLFTLGSSALY